jgi:hypothetical protein
VSFPKKESRHYNNNSKRFTQGIRISCETKGELLLLCRNSNDVNLKIYFKQYCKVLSKVTLAAKNVTNSNNKLRSTCKVINEEKTKTK